MYGYLALLTSISLIQVISVYLDNMYQYLLILDRYTYYVVIQVLLDILRGIIHIRIINSVYTLLLAYSVIIEVIHDNTVMDVIMVSLTVRLFQEYTRLI